MGRKQTKSTPRKVIDVEPEPEPDPDRISCLPGHVIDQILTYLPIKAAVRTSVLSTKWRNKWYTLPNLVFDRQCLSAAASEDPLVIERKILKIVDHVLLLHSEPINMFKFYEDRDLIGENLASDVDRWILHLTRRSIKELVLEVWMEGHFKIPWCLFSCQSLLHLKLHWCCLKPPTTFEGFRSLKSLDLNLVTVAQDAFENLISGCPLLEKLKLTEVDGFTQINIRAPNLKFLEIHGEYEGINFDNTFQLATVVIDLWWDFNFESSNQSRSPGRSRMLKFFYNRPHIQSLVIQSYFLKYLAAGVLPKKLPIPCMDLSNLSLTINFDNLKEIRAALCLLRSSPNLRKLEIFTRIGVLTAPLTPAAYCWENIFSAPDMPILVRHVAIDGLFGTKLELDFIKFLLLYSPVLEKMTLKPVENFIPELMRGLIRFKRASGEAEIILEDPS